MFTFKSITKLTSFLLVVILLVGVLPTYAVATTNPWSSYSQFIPAQTPVVKRHFRAAWISTIINLDWPTAETRKIEDDQERIQKSKDELIAILDRAVEMNLNAVFFQVSPEADALYKSNIVPWSRYLTGTFGKDPGFDPLAFAIEQSRKRNLELHAWFNPYRVSMNTNAATIDSLNIDKSVYKEHPEWIKPSNNRLIVDPGIPEAREWVISRVMEVLENYDVDGIHFDDYFYYEKYVGEMKDDDTFRKYNQGQFNNKDDWRRNNTYILVRELGERIRATKPWVKYGISPAGVWGNKSPELPEGSNTRAGFTNYDKSFADTKKWVQEEIIDYIAPQIYFSYANSAAPYGEVASWWSQVVKGKNVHLYIGNALYKVNDSTEEYFRGVNALPEFSNQMKFNVVNPQITGSIMFRFQNFNDSAKQQVVNRMKDDLWSTKVLVPLMPWKGGQAPQSPTQGRAEALTKGTKLTWIDNDSNTAYYAIYRINKDARLDIASDDSARHLIATMRKTSNGIQQFIDLDNSNADNTIYLITALDRLHNESRELMVTSSLSRYFRDIVRHFWWAVEAIDRSFERKIIFGDGTGLFNPGHNTTRADFTLMVVRALGLQADFEDNFIDVLQDSYYYNGVGIAKALGIAKGDGSGFNPMGNITRQDMMVIIDRAIGIAGIELEQAEEVVLEKYKDQDLISDYARQAVANLTQAELIQGSDGGVKPKATATRAEIVVVLDRLLNIVEQR